MGVGMQDIFLSFSGVGNSANGSDLRLNPLGPLNERFDMSRGFMLFIVLLYKHSMERFTNKGEV